MREPNKRISFTSNSSFNQKDSNSNLQYGAEKIPSRTQTPFLDSNSVHSLQNLHPFKFRVVNPDLVTNPPQDDLDRLPESPSINSHYSGSSEIMEAHAQSTAFSHMRSSSIGTTARRRSGSIKSPQIGPERRRSGAFQSNSETIRRPLRDSTMSEDDFYGHSAYEGYN